LPACFYGQSAVISASKAIAGWSLSEAYRTLNNRCSATFHDPREAVRKKGQRYCPLIAVNAWLRAEVQQYF